MRPDDWMPGTVDAIATASADGRRIVIKAVNYRPERNTLLVRLQGASVPGKAVATLHTISAGLKDSASLDHPNAIAPVSRTLALRDGPHRGPGPLHGRGSRDPGGMKAPSTSREPSS